MQVISSIKGFLRALFDVWHYFQYRILRQLIVFVLGGWRVVYSE